MFVLPLFPTPAHVALLQLFPGSDWVAASAALAHYNMRNFDEAQALYEDLLARDPARLAVRGGIFGRGPGVVIRA